MSYGNKMSAPLSAPDFLAQVAAHNDYRNKGYVWGQSGHVHYCFMDTDKVRFDIWQKRLHAHRLALVLINVAALVGLIVAGFPQFAAAAFLGIPSLPFALMDHYAQTAIEQKAAVVTNGPQMQYPGGVTTRDLVKRVSWVGGASALIGVVMTWGAKTPFAEAAIAGVSVAFLLKVLVVAGTGFNAAALAIFLLGYLTKPFGWVVSPSLDVRELAINGWSHLGRNSTPLNTYRIAPEQPQGLRWGCGGLIPIIRNRQITNWAARLSEPPDGIVEQTFKPRELIIWGIVPVAPAGQTVPDEAGSSPGDGGDTAWNDKRWDELTPEQQERWAQLGWNRELWDGEGSPASEETPWDELSDDERDAATRLGYDELLWNGIELRGHLFVVGTETFDQSVAIDLRRLGATQAVACDGHLSPLLGTHGDLLIETSPALDPIQWYGFMAVPE